MRLYEISCEQCGWKAPLPVDADVAASDFVRQGCRDCAAAGRPFPFKVKERIVIGPTQFFPAKGAKQ